MILRKVAIELTENNTKDYVRWQQVTEKRLER